MKIRWFYILLFIFFSFGTLSYSQPFTSDDLITKVKSIVDIDFEQEDQLKPIMDDYVDAFNKIYDLIQKGVDKEVIAQKMLKLDDALDIKLKSVLTADQWHQWDIEKKVFYKEILTPANDQNQ